MDLEDINLKDFSLKTKIEIKNIDKVKPEFQVVLRRIARKLNLRFNR